MSEADVLQRVRNLAAAAYRHKQIIRGIGDDCAILRPETGDELVFTTDFVLQDRHFTLDTHSAADVGHKALARSLSDLAAMGSEPVFCLVSLAIPAELAGKWTEQFYKGLLALALKYRITLAGGDLSRFDQVVIDVMCCGRVPRGQAILRSGAKPGDRICVTGNLGGSAAGFHRGHGPGWKRHLRPEPRVDVGIALRKLGVRAGMDVSAGLALDLHRLCLESGVSAEIDGQIPIARGATLDEALSGGEDYELLFAAPNTMPLPRTVDGLTITVIGKFKRGDAGRLILNSEPLEPKGFDHFV